MNQIHPRINIRLQYIINIYEYILKLQIHQHLEKNLDALVEIEKLLHRPDRELQDSTVNSLQK